MLHELLLALSGHPSPLLQSPTDKSTVGTLHEHLSPAERVLLQRLSGDLGGRHTAIRDHATQISSTHSSTVCRAIATSVTLTHLAKFQQAILDVERDILEENPKYVGAYNIVPLSAIVGAFDGWSRKLQWLLSLVQYMQAEATAVKKDSGKASCTAAQVIKWLRDAANTGYPDIEQLSGQLIQVAETAWLRLLSTWVLYGKLPTLGKADFFVHRKGSSAEQRGIDEDYETKPPLIPCFVTESTANSILFIGKSLNRIRNRSSRADPGWSKVQCPELALLHHLGCLSSLKSSISAAGFSAAISSIRLSLSQNILQKLLPISRVLEILRILRDFFLLERGEFAIALIAAADQRLVSRQSRLAEKLGTKDVNSFKSAIIKEGEVSAVLAQTWAAMVSLQGVDDEDVDEDLELARDLISLSLGHLGPVVADGTDGTAATFDDLLLPSPITLSLHIPSPLDLFLTPQDVDTYSRIHSYLLSIRRAHLRLSKVFLLSVLRRDHPSPKAPAHLNPQEQLNILRRIRQRANHRTKILRPVWATISSAAFLLAELGEYLQGEVVKSSWTSFHSWLDPSSLPPSTRPGTSSSANSAPLSQRLVQASHDRHGPESLTRAHRTYLSFLTRHLLFEDLMFTTELRRFMYAIDHLAALMQRLETIHQNLNLEADMGIVDTFTNYSKEERDVMSEVRVAQARVKESSGKLIVALGEVDTRNEREESSNIGVMEEGEDVFLPESAARVDRLLVKLTWPEREKDNE